MEKHTILIDNACEVVHNVWLWIPMATILLYLLLRNNDTKNFYLNIFALLFIGVLDWWINKTYFQDTCVIVGLFFVFTSYFLWVIQSGKLIFPILISFILFIALYPNCIVLFLLNIFISLMVYILSRYVSKCIFKDRKSFISKEYTKSGYRIREINMLVFCLYIMLYAILLYALYLAVYI